MQFLGPPPDKPARAARDIEHFGDALASLIELPGCSPRKPMALPIMLARRPI
jgi:hypothetical protein